MGGIPDFSEFFKRQLSWVAEDGACFFKIPRSSNSVTSDIVDPECISEARKEFVITKFLADLDESINKPLRVEQACIVYPLMSGPDMIDFIRKQKESPVIQDCIEASIRLLGRLHRATIDVSHLREHDYAKDRFLEAPPNLVGAISARRKTAVIDGFEVRNFRYDDVRDKWLFFDPHNIRRGIPEEDIARFIVSLLMLNWGKIPGLRVWTEFYGSSLLKAYEKESSVIIDESLLKYAFQLILNVRRYYAQKSVREMSFMKRILARIYLEIYFHQMQKWVNRYDITL